MWPCYDPDLQHPILYPHQPQSGPIAQALPLIHISQQDQGHSRLDFQVKRRQTGYIYGVQILHRVPISILRPFDSVCTVKHLSFTWKLPIHQSIDLMTSVFLGQRIPLSKKYASWAGIALAMPGYISWIRSAMSGPQTMCQGSENT